MSTITGWYYLHTNGELIFKRDSPGQDADIRESDFARALWAWTGERADAWSILVEALSIGANKDRIKELSEKWGCDDRDAENYAEYLGVIIREFDGKKRAYKKLITGNENNPMGTGETYL